MPCPLDHLFPIDLLKKNLKVLSVTIKSTAEVSGIGTFSLLLILASGALWHTELPSLHMHFKTLQIIHTQVKEHGDSVVECLNQKPGVAG